MKKELKEHLSYYRSELSEEQYEILLDEIDKEFYLDLYELNDELDSIGVDIDKID